MCVVQDLPLISGGWFKFNPIVSEAFPYIAPATLKKEKGFLYCFFMCVVQDLQLMSGGWFKFNPIVSEAFPYIAPATLKKEKGFLYCLVTKVLQKGNPETGKNCLSRQRSSVIQARGPTITWIYVNSDLVAERNDTFQDDSF